MAYKQFYRIKSGDGVPLPPPITFDRVDEIQNFLWILLSVRLGAGIEAKTKLTPVGEGGSGR